MPRFTWRPRGMNISVALLRREHQRNSKDGTVRLVSREGEEAGSTIVTAAGSSYKGFRFPPEVISHCVWLYHRFPLSFRDVQELMLERGVDVSYDPIRAWCDRFGQEYANQLRRRGPRPGEQMAPG